MIHLNVLIVTIVAVHKKGQTIKAILQSRERQSYKRALKGYKSWWFNQNSDRITKVMSLTSLKI